MNLDSVLTLVEFIAGLVVLIILHEFGHFLAARFLNVEVEEFGIGFPPRITKLFEAWGTEFTLNWIPLGGFVRPKGENDPEVPGGLASATPWVRLTVLAAGSLVNIFIGVILAILLFYSWGDPIEEKVLIQQVAPASPAEMAGLQAEDLILAVNGQAIDGVTRLQELINANLGKTVEVTFQRGEEQATVALTPRAEPPPNEGPTGIMLGNPTEPIGWGAAISRGVEAVYQQVRGILLLPVRLIQGTAEPEEGRLVGYKGLYDIYSQIRSPLWFFMVISISLGVLNLFPIPALDGGRILLILPEIIFRRRIPPHYENMIHLVGFTLLLILIIFINVQDFINPVQLP
ncbi:MAG TPA: M50 family metallopeptidase [Anaerolineales bacterium]|nr:M50 family metallopeptidase [Anaerolineales bacterium]